jgi:hypothetical protein
MKKDIAIAAELARRGELTGIYGQQKRQKRGTSGNAVTEASSSTSIVAVAVSAVVANAKGATAGVRPAAKSAKSEMALIAIADTDKVVGVKRPRASESLKTDRHNNAHLSSYSERCDAAIMRGLYLYHYYTRLHQ